MRDQRNRDDELAAQLRNAIRAESRKFWSLLVMFLIWSAIFVGILKFHLPLESGGMAALAVLILWIVAMFRFTGDSLPADGHYSEEVLRRTIDDQHRRWRWFYAFIFAFVGGCAIATSFMLVHPFLGLAHPSAGHALSRLNPLVAALARTDPAVMAPAMYLIMAAVVAALQVCFGPGFLKGAYRRALNDELTRAMQRSAAMSGYLFCVVAMCAVFGAMVFRPQWGLIAMPGAIGASVILPGLYFLFLQWRSERDG